jgi:rhodanese-related sulfurtransferase
VLVDVREPDEWRLGHAPEARLIPMGQVSAHLDELQQARQVVAVCRSGGRSAVVTVMLRAVGVDARNIEGGMRAWKAASLPVVAEED